jgi:hypothetical protein
MYFFAKTCSPKKVTHAQVDFVDAAGVSTETDRAHVVAALSTVREADGIVHVVRHFESPSAPPHPHGSLDARRDVAEMEAELLVTDLDVVERRIERLQKQATKPVPQQERDHDRKELALMERIKSALESGRRVAAMGLTTEESAMLRAFQFLSEKPAVYVLNVAEGELQSPGATAAAQSLGPHTVLICAKVEKEISELEPSERAEFLAGMGIGEPAARRVIRACYKALGLRSFFTGTGISEDCRSWTVRAGDNALAAAGKIHSDMARGFIRAEVITFEDFKTAGGMKEARAAGKMRLEGKEYEVQDGDIITFRFKV